MLLEDTQLRMTSTMSWAKARHAGQRAWQVSSAVDAMMDGGEYTETIFLAEDDLRPLHQLVAQGTTQQLELHYADREVTGTATLPDGTQNAVNATLDEPVVGHVETALAALPLETGYATTLRSFEAPTQKQRVWEVRVTGTSDLTTEAGSFETFRVEVADAGSLGSPAVFWVTQASPHRSVRSVQTLPSSHGGGMILAELVSLEEGG